MADSTADRAPQPNDAYGPYTTTYDREFWGNPGHAAQADRPASTQAFHAQYLLSGPIGNSNYAVDYCQKPIPKPDFSAPGTSSGNRHNNPHPSHAFMVWRLPGRQQYEQPPSAADLALTDEIMDKVCRGQLKSTYQSDFMGARQKKKHVSSENISERNHHYSLASQMRHSYQMPEKQSLLKGNTSRYGCNKLKNMPANGVVPTVSTRPTNIQNRTAYYRDYTDIVKPPGLVGMRDFGRNCASNAIAPRNTDSGDEPRPAARLGYHPSPIPIMMSPWVGPM